MRNFSFEKARFLAVGLALAVSASSCAHNQFREIARVALPKEMGAVRRIQCVRSGRANAVVFLNWQRVLGCCDWKRGRVEWALPARAGFEVQDFAVSQDGRRIATIEVGPWQEVEPKEQKTLATGTPSQVEWSWSTGKGGLQTAAGAVLRGYYASKGELVGRPGPGPERTTAQHGPAGSPQVPRTEMQRQPVSSAERDAYPPELRGLFDALVTHGYSRRLRPTKLRIIDTASGDVVRALEGPMVMGHVSGILWADVDSSIVVLDRAGAMIFSRLQSLDAESGLVRWTVPLPNEWVHNIRLDSKNNRVLGARGHGFFLCRAHNGHCLVAVWGRGWQPVGLLEGGARVLVIIDEPFSDRRDEQEFVEIFLHAPLNEDGSVPERVLGGVRPTGWESLGASAISPDERFAAVAPDSEARVYVYDITCREDVRLAAKIRTKWSVMIDWTAAGELVFRDGRRIRVWQPKR